MEEMTYAFPKQKELNPSSYIDAYVIVAECSQMRTPKEFVTKLLELLEKACPYDEAVVFFFNSNGRVEDRYLVRAKPERLDAYMSYYINVIPKDYGDFDLYAGSKEHSGAVFSKNINWSELPKSESKKDYIDFYGLKYSWSFSFFDQLGSYRAIICLDRTRDTPFSEAEKNRLNLALPILNNMYRNFFYQAMEMGQYFGHLPWERYRLTKREREIADYLCQGMTAQTISASLCISVTTIYKHISNIFKKTGVKNQQELIVKLLNKKK